MSAYVIVDIEIRDPEMYARYSAVVSATVEQYGGSYLVIGGKPETLEGDWLPKRVVVLEFPSVAQAKKWWSSEEYREPKALRLASTDSKMIVVEGVSY